MEREHSDSLHDKRKPYRVGRYSATGAHTRKRPDGDAGSFSGCGFGFVAGWEIRRFEISVDHGQPEPTTGVRVAPVALVVYLVDTARNSPALTKVSSGVAPVVHVAPAGAAAGLTGIVAPPN